MPEKKIKSFDNHNVSILDNQLHTIITSNVVIKGNILCNDLIRIDGKVYGNIIGNCEVYISQNAEIEGDIFANDITTSGKIKGNLFIKNRVNALKTSNINGNIICKKFYGEEGMIIKGKIKATENSELTDLIEKKLNEYKSINSGVN